MSRISTRKHQREHEVVEKFVHQSTAVNGAVAPNVGRNVGARRLGEEAVRLREALGKFVEGTAGMHFTLHDGQPCRYCEGRQALADTEAAATTWLETDRREQRLGGGAREFAGRWRSTYGYLDRPKQTEILEAMEREA